MNRLNPRPTAKQQDPGPEGAWTNLVWASPLPSLLSGPSNLPPLASLRGRTADGAPSRGWHTRIKLFLWLNLERTLQNDVGRWKVVVSRRQLKRSSLCRGRWLKRSSFLRWHHQLSPRVTPTLVTPPLLCCWRCEISLSWAWQLTLNKQ